MSVHLYHLGNGEPRWRFSVDLVVPIGARRKQKVQRGFKNQEDAEVAEAAFIRTHGAAAKPETEAGTIEAEMLAWCDMNEIDTRQTTYQWYRTIVRTYIAPHIGKFPKHMLDDAMCNKLYRKLRKSGNKNGGPLSQSTVRGVHKTISAYCSDNKIKLGDDVRIPPANKVPGRLGTWTKEQCVRFLTCVSNDRLFAAWVLAVVC